MYESQIDSQSAMYATQTMQQAPAQPQQNQVANAQPQGPTTSQLCKSCFTSKAMKVFVSISVFVICPVLIVMIGGFCPYYLISMKVKNMFPPFLFSIYTLIFALVLLLVEFKVKFIGNIFLFLLSPTYRALFLVFLGTLSMAAYESVPKREWIGYLIGSLTIIIGVFHIVIGCLDKEWKKQQVQKYQQQGEAQGWEQSKVQLNQTQPMASSNQYPSVAGDAGIGYSQAAPQPYPYQHDSSVPYSAPSQSNENRPNVMAETARMPETQQLMQQAAVVAGGAMINGSTTEQAASAAAANPQVQQLAADAAIAAAKNPQVRSAAAQAASQTANKLLSTAYDKIFEDE
ncbi:uncharacterized protein MONOS_3408 [Monocercomonoides exilis]|uniref:uncharacterized protein n=1 Tax=Monocercomonoides exilis TaxID=2049356 RepID=UPI00355A1BCF|nr:hypothetical protein MONOS_3408 [Monocercomonoides exilis]|eukprot:MONOS_3408.1-p1 / transcript=MONOS_3408.1 / gene=MONOS_3408 / organism=Monocercomonoides_exilis_PA203 / gene_product=unspecified product / transcript_product=unspecified product / location=Mono_scaffold00080:54894-56237(+) / protein_length=343 / sequence_SO=supercontig / SO=protein_coding / is_pseudo=false